MTATLWRCSQRCWQEGGPHDEICTSVTRETEVVTAPDGNLSIVVKRDPDDPPKHPLELG